MAISNDNGKIGEDIAAEFYEANGYKILERNYHAGHNEIDIIAEKDNNIAFSEVKTRTLSPALDKYGSAKSAVDREKRKHLLEAARYYLKANPWQKEKCRRMDVVEVYLTPTGDFLKISYIRNAFGATEEYY